MGPDPLLSASHPLPLALSTTLQENYFRLVRQGEGVKLNIHWLLLIAFFRFIGLQIKLEDLGVLEVGRLCMCKNVCVRGGCIYLYQLLSSYYYYDF